MFLGIVMVSDILRYHQIGQKKGERNPPLTFLNRIRLLGVNQFIPKIGIVGK